MNVILVNPPIHLPLIFAHYPMFSTLGLLANAAWLEKLGHQVRVVDSFTLCSELEMRAEESGMRQVGVPAERVVAAVGENVAGMGLGAGGDELAICVAVTMFSELNRIQETLVPATVTLLREAFPKAALGLADMHICGMNYFPYDPRRVLASLPSADWIVVGEGEPTIPRLLARLAAGLGVEGLPRVAHRPGGEAIAYDPSPPEIIKNIDSLPPPAFHLINMDNYFSVQADAIRAGLVHEYHVVERQIPLMTSRGCPHRCNFCTNQVLDLPWRAHSVDYLKNVLTDLKDRYEVDRFLFLDDNINVNAGRFRQLVAWMARARLPWDAVNGFRADQLDRDAVRAIKAAGNTKITVSAESGDPDLLRKVINKRLKLGTVIELARICQEEQVPLQVHYIMGVPGETKARINKTLEFATRLFELYGAWPLLQHAIPFPGTALFRECEESGYFTTPPHEVPGESLEIQSIIETPEFNPDDVSRMKRNAQHLHAATQAMVFLDIERRCTARCLACHCLPDPTEGDDGMRRQAAREGFDRGGEAPRFAELSAQLEQARFLGAREVFIGGGEPTLSPLLPRLLASVREMGFSRTTLLTNAHGLVSPAVARRILGGRDEQLVDRLVIDLFAAQAPVHDEIAALEGAHERTLAGVAEAVKSGITDLEARIPVLIRNLSLLVDTVRFARGLGIRSIRLVYPQPDSRAFAREAVARFEDARDAMLRAVLLGRKLQTEISVQGVPLCMLPDLPGVLTPLPPWALQRARPHRVRHPVCRECTEYILCGGFFRPEYDPCYGMLASRGLL